MRRCARRSWHASRASFALPGEAPIGIHATGHPSFAAATQVCSFCREVSNVHNLRVFISSKQSEFELERALLKHEVEAIPRLEADLAEEWSPQRVEVRKVFLERVMAAHFYVGLFGRV